MEDKIKVVILCGGQGTRLKEETEFKPKPMVNIGGKPILWHIMKHYAFYGFKDFILCLGYKGEMIKEYFLNYQAMNSDFTIRLGSRQRKIIHSKLDESDWSVTLADTGLLTNSGGRIKKIQKYIGNKTFMLTYGDGVSNVNLIELLKFHLSHGKIATVTGVRPLSRFGMLDIKGDQVTWFGEKKELKEGWINGGFFVFNHQIFDYLEEDSMLESEPLENLAKDGQLAVFKHYGFWQCMDTYRDMEALNQLWSSGKAPWRIWK